MTKLRALWWRIVGSLWFVPALMVIGAVLLAGGLVEAETLVEVKLGERWPRFFGAAADGARGMLQAIAGSMITVAGVVFSVTLVALSLAASQYSPRVLRAFMADRPTQVVLGTFVGIFAYCLVVLRTIRGGDGDAAFVPSIAVSAGLVLAFVGIGLLVFFIHHLASSIEASSIMGRVGAATLRAVDGLFPQEVGEPAEETRALETVGETWAPVAARETGYIVSVDDKGLLALARARGRVVRMEHGIGDFVVAGRPLASLDGRDAASEQDETDLNACYSFGRQRTIEQDVGFGIQQLVDIGQKALSPGINDPTTAIMCVDRLTEIMARLARRRIESPYRRDEGRLRVIAAGPSFAHLVELAYAELRNDARGKRPVLRRLLWSVEEAGASTGDPVRRRVLAAHARGIAEAAQRETEAPQERDEIVAAAVRLAQRLAGAEER